MKLPGQVNADQEYEFDKYTGQYYKQDPGHVIRRRVAVAKVLLSKGATKSKAWAQVFAMFPKLYEDPMTGEAYPEFDPDSFEFPSQ
jgi:hypothetical protein